MVLVRAEALPEDQRHADREQTGLEGDHAGQRVARVSAGARGERDREQHQAECREPDAKPLPGADGAAEEALGQDREEHEPAADQRLDERERRQRQRAHVEDPGAHCHEHPDREPLGAEQPDRAANRVAHVHVRRGAGPPVLERKPRLVAKRAQQREKDSDLESHRL